jgi:hypothetical protein
MNRFHAKGSDDYIDAGAGMKLRWEEAKLRRRINRLCHPKSLSGHIILAVRGRLLVGKLRKRFDPDYALFGKANQLQES